ncbi:Bit61/Bit2 [Kluyveromyces lactis]|uniref:KLLA0F01529p n=1 Tax=Kluyveromyces lactis (strain ATCC 8585 / CBS 2359 / DSM 70799 / NBRC 1267 / NRRL Y-1140 / WM37) TaxID=284590 RepID=Q6CLP0_KLULA|nr:uncharacterized protein KLLA0_F01529g [Kluyveromyces lactis]QEU58352.1 Bit61/Bit2 [Kluyveromyces lactis]CAG97856.1 KLLA0F01529p [Kluyveromyces lactis]|eukprot:XP_455149.1 uncharacterized protein KLLA0_F01529g [Kluyveromyces lactis]
MKKARKRLFHKDDSPVAPPLNIDALLKNVHSLELNYQGFQPSEKKALLRTISALCKEVIENAMCHGLDGCIKLEDLNLLFRFYVDLEKEFKLDFNKDIKKMILEGLAKFENDFVLNSNEKVINVALKRLCAIWARFYSRVYPDCMICLIQIPADIEQLLLICFRDAIVLPYYKNFMNADEGISMSFSKYIQNEEENGVKQQHKLILIQCFGVLSSIKGKDMNQRLIEDLLSGVRRSIEVL